MLLNAVFPIPVLQKLLEHRNIETTLQFTRLYDSLRSESGCRTESFISRTIYYVRNGKI